MASQCSSLNNSAPNEVRGVHIIFVPEDYSESAKPKSATGPRTALPKYQYLLRMKN